jgi:hypothetical protein
VNIKRLIATALLLLAFAFTIQNAAAVPDQTRGMALLSFSITAGNVFTSSSGVTSINVANVGLYELTFDRSILDCSAVASIGPGDTVNPGIGTAVTGAMSGNANGLVVQTFNAMGNHAFMAFSLVVFCPR